MDLVVLRGAVRVTIADEARAVGEWLGATDAPVDVIAAQELVVAALSAAGTEAPTEPGVCKCGHPEWRHAWNAKELPDGRGPFSAAACTAAEGCDCQDFAGVSAVAPTWPPQETESEPFDPPGISSAQPEVPDVESGCTCAGKFDRDCLRHGDVDF
jgi:hypothetical protein